VLEAGATTMQLRGATLVDGRVVDVMCAGGVITSVAPTSAQPVCADPIAAGAVPGDPGTSQHGDAGETAEVVDLAGYLLLPAPAEPHAHLDKARTAAVVANPAGDLAGAIAAWLDHRPGLTVDDLVARGRASALDALAKGVTALRTHVDVAADIGLRAVEAMVQVREELRPLLDIQVVAFAMPPTVGPEGAEHRALLRAAVDAGADVVGGCPLIEDDGRAATEQFVALAGDCGRPLDLHVDEVLDPARLDLVHLATAVEATGFDLGATASHCVSLGVQPVDVQRRLAARLAAAGVGVVALPLTNLYLQARGVAVAPPRAITAVAALTAAGVTVAAGGDNVHDPFNPLGRSDPLEAATLMVAVAHRSPCEAYDAVSVAARRVMGLPPVAIAAGAPAELLAIRASSLSGAIGSASEDRLVVHHGRVVARTTVTTHLATEHS
jgi:cytosine/creatinine deaminase